MRVICFIGIALSWYLQPWVFLAATVYYAWRFPLAIELLVLAALLDGYYGLALEWSLPLYSLLIAGVLVMTEWMRPMISRYNTDTL